MKNLNFEDQRETIKEKLKDIAWKIFGGKKLMLMDGFVYANISQSFPAKSDIKEVPLVAVVDEDSLEVRFISALLLLKE